MDLAQAAIGPGMAVYTRYAKVLDAEGKPLSVRAALSLINLTLDEALAELLETVRIRKTSKVGLRAPNRVRPLRTYLPG